MVAEADKYDGSYLAAVVRHLTKKEVGISGSIATSSHPLSESLSHGLRTVRGYVVDNLRDDYVNWAIAGLIVLGVGYAALSQSPESEQISRPVTVSLTTRDYPGSPIGPYPLLPQSVNKPTPPLP